MKKTSPIVVFAIIITLIMLALRFTPIPTASDPADESPTVRPSLAPAEMMPESAPEAPVGP